MKDEEKERHAPIHTHIKSDPISTPGYWRLFTTWIMMRYGARVGVDMFHEKNQREAAHKQEADNEFKGIRTALQDGTHHHPEIQEDLAKYNIPAERAEEAHKAYAIIKEVRNHSEPHAVWTKGDEGIKTDAERTVKRFEEDLKGSTKKFRDSAISAKKEHYKDVADRINGGITLAGTGIYAARVASDIKSVFAETVAYEHDKDPGNVSWKDLFQSDNTLVDTAIKNYVKYNSLRVASDAVFFLRDIAKIKVGKYSLGNVGGLDFTKTNGTDLGMAVKGLMLSRDILTKQTTFFEDTIRLIDTKLNPIRGLGEQVTASDVTDLYQKYALDHKQSAAFKRVDYTDVGDSISWRHAEPIFDRIAELMNHTYHYKNPIGAKNENADFPLPKYLYLLGHDLVDLSKPKETMALIEVASCHGMKAVKEVASAFKRGISIEACLEKYPVDMTVLNELDTLSKKPLTHAQKLLAAGTGKPASMAERIQNTPSTTQHAI